MRVLVVEDEVKMGSLLRRGLQEEGHAADVARTGDDALWMAAAVDYDAIVLDVMLPGRDGFEVCRELRERGVWAPVLMLTARTAVEDRISGLDAGADDYLPKPFAFGELLARLRALARRGAPRAAAGARGGRAPPRSLDASGLARRDRDRALDEGVRAARDVHAPPGQVLSRYQLLEHAWDIAYENKSNVVDVYVRYLREKVDRPFGVESLETVRGAGYRLRAEAS